MNEIEKIEKLEKLYDELVEFDCNGVDCSDCPFNNGIRACDIIKTHKIKYG